MLSQNKKNCHRQVARTKQIIKKVLDHDVYLAARICTLFYVQSIAIVSVLTISMISTTVLASAGVFGGRGEVLAPFVSPNDENTLKKAKIDSKYPEKTCWKGC